MGREEFEERIRRLDSQPTPGFGSYHGQAIKGGAYVLAFLFYLPRLLLRAAISAGRAIVRYFQGY